MFTLDDENNLQACEDLYAWSRWMQEKSGSRVVALTERPGGIRISTAFVGLSPRPFETAIFNAAGTLTSITRYRTWQAAAEGHNEVVKEFDEKYPELKGSP